MIELEYSPYAAKLEEYFHVNVLNEEIEVSWNRFRAKLPVTSRQRNLNYGSAF